ncbi:unnamed protein product [Linum trigynum]|uniref:Uncharacterized protein n=1 Tax=Linum trigynum TaxID=586398 RepID=A0AAV2E9S7_9ROSI
MLEEKAGHAGLEYGLTLAGLVMGWPDQSSGLRTEQQSWPEVKVNWSANEFGNGQRLEESGPFQEVLKPNVACDLKKAGVEGALMKADGLSKDLCTIKLGDKWSI